MPSKQDRARQRGRTDQSLRVERQKTDDELGRRGGALDRDADEVVSRARERADWVLAAARAQADARSDATISTADRAARARERRTDDDRVALARAEANRVLEDERVEYRLALAGLLALERAATDQAIVDERALSDEVLQGRDDVFARVSHDLRTFLGGIALATALLIKEAEDDEAGRRTVRRAESIQRQMLHLNRLVSDLVDVAAIEARRLAVVAEPNDAAQVARDAAEAFHDAAAQKHISLTIEAAESLPSATFDRERIVQVLANLLGNALKFTGENGRIVLRVEPRDGEVQLSVSDTGPGVPADMRQRIFERFWQARRADRRGIGLGLFISKAIIEAHGGRIWVESKVGVGSTFFFTLPYA